tara:strand:- start:570 stop:794 length:225 start_codon:yes stop_codon:yes gene_type:complete
MKGKKMVIINKCPKCQGTLVFANNLDHEEELSCINCGLSTPTMDNFHKLSGTEMLMMLADKNDSYARAQTITKS